MGQHDRDAVALVDVVHGDAVAFEPVAGEGVLGRVDDERTLSLVAGIGVVDDRIGLLVVEDGLGRGGVLVRHGLISRVMAERDLLDRSKSLHGPPASVSGC